MPPKKLKTNQTSEEIKDEFNQTTTTTTRSAKKLRESNQTPSTSLNMDNQSKSTTLNLSFKLKADIISSLVKFLGLLRGQPSAPSDKKELFDSNIEIIKQLSILTSGDSGLNDSLDLIDESLLEDSNGDGGLFFELNFSTRRDIVDLLTRNFSSIFISKCFEVEKKNLIQENNDMINLLLILDDKHLKTADKGDNNRAIHNRPTKRIKFDDRINECLEKVEKLENEVKEIDNLKRQLKQVDVNRNEVEFYFRVKGVENFLKSMKAAHSGYFYCSSMKWCLLVLLKQETNGVKHLYLCLKPEDFIDSESYKWAIKASYDLILIHPLDEDLSWSDSVSNHLFTRKTGRRTCFEFINHEDLLKYVQDDTIELGIKLRTEIVNEFKDRD